MLIVTLFIAANTWKQPRYLSTDEWINSGSQTVEYYSVLKRNELLYVMKTHRETLNVY